MTMDKALEHSPDTHPRTSQLFIAEESQHQSTVGDFVSAEEIAKRPPPEHVVEDIVIRGGVSLLAAESGTGKSFLALSLGAAVSEGRPWSGRDVTHGRACRMRLSSRSRSSSSS